MNINFGSIQNFLNSSTFQLIVKPIVLTVTAIALAIFAVYAIAACCRSSNRRIPPHATPQPRPEQQQRRVPHNQPNQPSPRPDQTLGNPNPTPNNPWQLPRPEPRPNPFANPPSLFTPRPVQPLNPFTNPSSPFTRPGQMTRPLTPAQSPGREWEMAMDRSQLVNPMSLIADFARELHQRGVQMRVKVKFNGETGEDDGGLRRTFFREISSGIKGQTEICTALDDAGLCQFAVNGKYLIPKYDEQLALDGTVYQDLGALLAYVYLNEESLLIGDLFHEAVYGAILAFTDQEIDADYHNLSSEAKLKACHTFASLMAASKKDPDMRAIRVIEFLQKGINFTEEDLNSEEFSQSYFTLFGKNDDSDFSDLDMMAFDSDSIAKILNNREGFRRECLGLIQRAPIFAPSSKNAHGDIPQLWEILAPLHAMAKGMKIAAGPRFQDIRRAAFSTNGSVIIEGVKSIKSRIQGALDREEIISHIRINGCDKNPARDPRIVSVEEMGRLMLNSGFDPNSVITQEAKDRRDFMRTQVGWIEEWIRREQTSDMQVEGLLRFWTGTTCIDWSRLSAENPYIEVQGMSDVAFSEPGATTCVRVLQIRDERYHVDLDGVIYSNRTREEFFSLLDFICLPENSEKTTKK